MGPVLRRCPLGGRIWEESSRRFFRRARSAPLEGRRRTSTDPAPATEPRVVASLGPHMLWRSRRFRPSRARITVLRADRCGRPRGTGEQRLSDLYRSVSLGEHRPRGETARSARTQRCRAMSRPTGPADAGRTLTIAEAAAVCDVDERTIARDRRAGRCPGGPGGDPAGDLADPGRGPRRLARDSGARALRLLPRDGGGALRSARVPEPLGRFLRGPRAVRQARARLRRPGPPGRVRRGRRVGRCPRGPVWRRRPR